MSKTLRVRRPTKTQHNWSGAYTIICDLGAQSQFVWGMDAAAQRLSCRGVLQQGATVFDHILPRCPLHAESCRLLQTYFAGFLLIAESICTD